MKTYCASDYKKLFIHSDTKMCHAKAKAIALWYQSSHMNALCYYVYSCIWEPKG